MSEHERLRKVTTERDIARLRLKKARGALYRIIKAIEEFPTPDRELRIHRIAKSGCGTPKKRKKAGLPGQIDLEDYLAGRN